MDKTINDVLLKSLTFQTEQTKWDGGSNSQYLASWKCKTGIKRKRLIIVVVAILSNWIMLMPQLTHVASCEL